MSELVDVERLQEELEQAEKDDPRRNPPELEGCPDMVALSYLEEHHILHNLQARYEKSGFPDIYTSMSNILVAVNPYQKLPIYTEKTIEEHNKYRGAGKAPQPHIFGVSSRTYKNLMFFMRDQSILVCGESGSGKTETAKLALKYLTATTPVKVKSKKKPLPLTASGASDGEEKTDEFGIEKQILAVNPLLEAFGNAQTIMNNNSSRFAKFTKVIFSKFKKKLKKGERQHCMIIGSTIETYLLEKPRVIQQDKGEKNFHIFYQIYQLPKADRKKLGLLKQKEFKFLHYIFKTKLAPGQQDMYASSSFQEIQDAMIMLKISKEEQMTVFGIVAGILHLGNINFEKDDQGTSEWAKIPEDDRHLRDAARLFQVEPEALAKCLTTRNIQVAGQTIEKTLELEPALLNRNSMAKSIYNGVFQYLVWRMNIQLLAKETEKAPDGSIAPSAGESGDSESESESEEESEEDEPDLDDDEGDEKVSNIGKGNPFIGILDVFGFECFESNSFEQFCINYANERLQQYFNEYIVASEQREYLREGVEWTEIDIPDTGECITFCKMLYKELDSVCMQPGGGPTNLIQNVTTRNKDGEFFIELGAGKGSKPRHRRQNAQLLGGSRKPGKASRKTRFGNFEGFGVKHFAGQVIYDAKEFLNKNQDNTSRDAVVLFSESKAAIMRQAVGDIKSLEEKEAATKKGRKKRSFQSVGTTFANQMELLMNDLSATDPHFVRCVNPNSDKKPKRFVKAKVLSQLRCGGLIQGLRVMKLGYPTRIPYAKIYNMYEDSKLREQLDNFDARDFCQAVLIAFGLDEGDYQLGISKIFFRPAKAELLHDILEGDGDLTDEQLERIRKWQVGKRIARFRGVIRSYVLLIMIMRSHRAWKNWFHATGVLQVTARTFGRALKRARRKIRQKRLKQTVKEVQYRIASRKIRESYLKKLHDVECVVMIQRVWRKRKWRKSLGHEVARRIDDKRKAARLMEDKKKEDERLMKLAEKLERERIEKEKREAEERERQRRLAEREEKRRVERERREQERLAKEEEERTKREDEERKRREEEERRRHEEEERLKKLEEERRQREEEERKRREKEETERRQKEEEERLKREEEFHKEREEEEKRRQQQEVEFKIRMEQLEKERQERIEKEEKERQERLEAEAAEKESQINRVEEERKKRDEEERVWKEEIERQETERKLRFEQEETERRNAYQEEQEAMVKERLQEQEQHAKGLQAVTAEMQKMEQLRRERLERDEQEREERFKREEEERHERLKREQEEREQRFTHDEERRKEFSEYFKKLEEERTAKQKEQEEQDRIRNEELERERQERIIREEQETSERRAKYEREDEERIRYMAEERRKFEDALEKLKSQYEEDIRRRMEEDADRRRREDEERERRLEEDERLRETQISEHNQRLQEYRDLWSRESSEREQEREQEILDVEELRKRDQQRLDEREVEWNKDEERRRLKLEHEEKQWKDIRDREITDRRQRVEIEESELRTLRERTIRDHAKRNQAAEEEIQNLQDLIEELRTKQEEQRITLHEQHQRERAAERTEYQRQLDEIRDHISLEEKQRTETRKAEFERRTKEEDLFKKEMKARKEKRERWELLETEQRERLEKEQKEHREMMEREALERRDVLDEELERIHRDHSNLTKQMKERLQTQLREQDDLFQERERVKREEERLRKKQEADERFERREAENQEREKERSDHRQKLIKYQEALDALRKERSAEFAQEDYERKKLDEERQESFQELIAKIEQFGTMRKEKMELEEKEMRAKMEAEDKHRAAVQLKLEKQLKESRRLLEDENQIAIETIIDKQKRSLNDEMRSREEDKLEVEKREQEWHSKRDGDWKRKLGELVQICESEREKQTQLSDEEREKREQRLSLEIEGRKNELLMLSQQISEVREHFDNDLKEKQEKLDSLEKELEERAQRLRQAEEEMETELSNRRQKLEEESNRLQQISEEQNTWREKWEEERINIQKENSESVLQLVQDYQAKFEEEVETRTTDLSSFYLQQEEEKEKRGEQEQVWILKREEDWNKKTETFVLLLETEKQKRDEQDEKNRCDRKQSLDQEIEDRKESITQLSEEQEHLRKQLEDELQERRQKMETEEENLKERTALFEAELKGRRQALEQEEEKCRAFCEEQDEWREERDKLVKTLQEDNTNTLETLQGEFHDVVEKLTNDQQTTFLEEVETLQKTSEQRSAEWTLEKEVIWNGKLKEFTESCSNLVEDEKGNFASFMEDEKTKIENDCAAEIEGRSKAFSSELQGRKDNLQAVEEECFQMKTKFAEDLQERIRKMEAEEKLFRENAEKFEVELEEKRNFIEKHESRLKQLIEEQSDWTERWEQDRKVFDDENKNLLNTSLEKQESEYAKSVQEFRENAEKWTLDRDELWTSKVKQLDGILENHLQQRKDLLTKYEEEQESRIHSKLQQLEHAVSERTESVEKFAKEFEEDRAKILEETQSVVTTFLREKSSQLHDDITSIQSNFLSELKNHQTSMEEFEVNETEKASERDIAWQRKCDGKTVIVKQQLAKFQAELEAKGSKEYEEAKSRHELLLEKELERREKTLLGFQEKHQQITRDDKERQLQKLTEDLGAFFTTEKTKMRTSLQTLEQETFQKREDLEQHQQGLKKKFEEEEICSSQRERDRIQVLFITKLVRSQRSHA